MSTLESRRGADQRRSTNRTATERPSLLVFGLATSGPWPPGGRLPCTSAPAPQQPRDVPHPSSRGQRAPGSRSTLRDHRDPHAARPRRRGDTWPSQQPAWLLRHLRSARAMAAVADTDAGRVSLGVGATPSGSAEALSQFQCEGCGYGASTRTEPNRCPMCGGAVWRTGRTRRFGVSGDSDQPLARELRP